MKNMKYLKWTFWGIDLLICNIMIFAIVIEVVTKANSPFYSVVSDIGTYGMGVTCLLISIIYTICGGIVVGKLSKVYSCNSRPIVQFILMATFGSLANLIRFFGMMYSDIAGTDEYGNKKRMNDALFVIMCYCAPDIIPFTFIQIFLSIKLKVLNSS